MNTQKKSNTVQSAKQLARDLWLTGAGVSNETLASEMRVFQIGNIYGIYRLLVGFFLVLANYSTNEALKNGQIISNNLFSSEIEYVFLGLYFVFALFFLIVLYFWRENIRAQLLIGFIFDMIILTILLHSGVTKDLQIVLLYMVTTAASFMVLKLRHAISVTFIAILSLTFQQLYNSYKGNVSFLSLSDSIALSLALFAVGFLSWSISQRLSLAEASAYQNAREIKRLHALNKEVIENIESGIIVTNQVGNILIINQIAEALLRLPLLDAHLNLSAYLFERERQLHFLYKELVEWYIYDKDTDVYSLILPQKEEEPAINIRIHKKKLPEYGQLLILEDISREESYAQQLKLDSLGSLSASIAHEIRNPLNAITQASELILEDDNSQKSDNYDLIHMIYKQSRRINRIIEDVVKLSRQEPPKQQLIHLKNWLPELMSQHYPSDNIALSFHDEGEIYFDPHHLEQICINLINNAIRHTKKLPDIADVEIIIHTNQSHILMDILDNGDGVQKNDLHNLFSPFFTKSVGGTGLGLYLSKAFSEANHAKLIYLPNAKKTCFRLIIPPFRYGGYYVP